MLVNEITAQRFKQLKCCVLLPTFNNAKALASVVESVLQYTSDVVVVNDGSTDNTDDLLEKYAEVKVLSYLPNAGKGMALRRGFEFARNLGYEHVITMDTDGQHFADDLPVFLRDLEKNGPGIAIGARNMNQQSVPGKSSFGNKFSNFWFTLETGISLPDTQSGYRLYPVKLLEPIRFFTRKYEFEIEVIVRAAWSGIDVRAVPVKVYYPPAEERITHFRPFKDFSRISVLNTVLVLCTFLWIKPRDFFRSFKKKRVTEVLDAYLVRSHETPSVKAWSVAVGVFFGITPFWGFQMWFVLAVAWMFNLNKALAVLASNISIPPMIPVIVFLSIQMGRIWMGQQSVSMEYDKHLSLDHMPTHFLQYILGSFTLAALAAVVFGVATYIFVYAVKGKQTAAEQ